MRKPDIRWRQLVDWRAAIWAGIASGSVFFILNLFLIPLVTGGNSWVIVRFMASLVLGEGILPPPASFAVDAMMAAIIANTFATLVFGLLVAYVIHRGGLLLGILGGAILGVAAYGINFYALTYFFPWFFPLRGWVMAVNHMTLGALAGGIYEWLEVEKFIPVLNEESNNP
ncbi:MAG: hypothetical protein MUE70_07660 [Desulfobacterales bacterium]|jgi:hypothetical protein|nr:hypothetical protein [Desulfobacterales bacterium]